MSVRQENRKLGLCTAIKRLIISFTAVLSDNLYTTAWPTFFYDLVKGEFDETLVRNKFNNMNNIPVAFEATIVT
jgi:hypothetical protein